ncbi:MAG: heavy metal-binding domain-containing protein, partial [Pseudomonadota bacterium]
MTSPPTDAGAHCCGHTSGSASVADSRFDRVPAGYSGTIYICPMCPAVRDTENRGCPMCGMALEPE